MNLLKQETAGIFGITSAAVLAAWAKGAPPHVIYCLTGLGVAFIIFEKIRAIFQPRAD
ncbi:MAG TPA: hypothetical protein VM487_01505 [Phycisphaerae bacterium]|nr:hypothetical protein [Phycisphaerae bacterium]